MSSEFKRVGLVARRSRHAEAVDEEVLDSVRVVADVLDSAGVSIVLERHTASALGESSNSGLPRQALGSACDLIVVVGGDGSLLGVGRDLAAHNVPVLGVNRGGLGFLAGVSPDAIEDKLQAMLDGDFVSEDHFLLEAWVLRDGVEQSRSPALNDVV
ncbi:MAG: NAD(+)/NADH kinase, partial [Pseudomonadales bacterium]